MGTPVPHSPSVVNTHESESKAQAGPCSPHPDCSVPRTAGRHGTRRCPRAFATREVQCSFANGIQDYVLVCVCAGV